ncbi:hypothetical protein [Candidatus Jordarchaeum sp.]|uniref:hypothetical protein n=1 Tax=Candidatus Jordarchaeum sp. TaxID=2823881 RepID=UPI004049BCEE
MSSDELTLAEIVDLKEEGIRLPREFLELIGKPYAIMILSRSNGEVRLIPTDSSEVVKLSVEIDKLSQRFLRDLGLIIVKDKIEFLHTTGLCRKGKQCFYEGYIEKDKLSVKIEDLKFRVSQIEGVTNVEISLIKL